MTGSNLLRQTERLVNQATWVDEAEKLQVLANMNILYGEVQHANEEMEAGKRRLRQALNENRAYALAFDRIVAALQDGPQRG